MSDAVVANVVQAKHDSPKRGHLQLLGQ